MNQISPDELLLLLGSKEAELFLVRRQLAAGASDLARLQTALEGADAELAKLKADAAPAADPA